MKINFLELLKDFRREAKCDFATTQGLDRFAHWLEIRVNLERKDGSN